MPCIFVEGASDTSVIQEQVERLISESGGDGSWSVTYYDYRKGSVEVDISSNVLRTPASNVKLVTASAVIRLLMGINDKGNNNHEELKTTVFANISNSYSDQNKEETQGKTAENLGKTADIVLKGGGDMSLTKQDLRHLARNTTSFLKSESVKEIRLVKIDDSLFANDTFDDTWEVEDLDYYYGATVDSLSVDRGSEWLRCVVKNSTAPDGHLLGNDTGNTGNGITKTESGDVTYSERKVVCSWDFESDATRIIVNANVADENIRDHRLRVTYSRQHGAYVASGAMQEGENLDFLLPVFDVKLHAASVFRHELLQQFNSSVLTETTEYQNMMLNETDNLITVAEHASSIQFLLEDMLHRSDNQYAESFLRLVGAYHGRSGGINAIHDELTAMRVINNTHPLCCAISKRNNPKFLQRDGSGLSRHNRIAAIHFIRLLKAMLEYQTLQGERPFVKIGPLLLNLLESNCEPGTTLRHRMCNIPSGSVRAKTGSMTGVSALSGYIVDTSSRNRTSDTSIKSKEEVLGIFSIIVNNSEFGLADRSNVIDDIIQVFMNMTIPSDRQVSKTYMTGRIAEDTAGVSPLLVVLLVFIFSAISSLCTYYIHRNQIQRNNYKKIQTSMSYEFSDFSKPETL